LLDKDKETEVYFGFNESAAAYNSIRVTSEFLKNNGVKREYFTTIDITNESFPDSVGFDLVLSLHSWGFHYPVEVYLHDVKKSLKRGGVVILDIHHQSGVETLNRHFSSIEIIDKNKVMDRVVAQGLSS
jgi:SAM-dependent methyltransferase